MGKQPAIVIIARHGARLDAANKKWHLTSPTPYDPPLTYGGWIQCQALGGRIATILEEREEDVENTADKKSPTSNGKTYSEGAAELSSSKKRKRRKHKIIIHSSPFLRCVQTAIAISAGIGQYEEDSVHFGSFVDQSLLANLPIARHEAKKRFMARTSHGKEEAMDLDTPLDLSDPWSYIPTKLRLDAFLGEWLSPDYFVDITPPPSSVLMLASAKADLLRPGEEIRGADLFDIPVIDESPAETTSETGPTLSSEAKSRSHSMLDPTHSIPIRNRAVTFGGDPRNRSRSAGRRSMSRKGSLTYIPPVPTYAISSSDVIPTGYVAHARDACVNVDYQWDSMREPQNWGDGGEYGEEWSGMHRRFRTGLQQLLKWYESNGPSELRDDLSDGEDDPETELVLVLVTHGAGCNALIGAMTSAPVLLDVGMASLTMAVRKKKAVVSGLASQMSPPASRVRRGSLDLGIAEEFDMKIIASTEHLRSTSNPLGLNSPRLARSPAFASRRLGGADSPDGFSIGDPLSWRPSSSGGLGRSPSQRSYAASTSKSSSGLWNRSSRYSRDEITESNESDPFPNFQNGANLKSQVSPVTETIKECESAIEDNRTRPVPVPTRTPSQRGLWGSGTSVERDEIRHKRRWTSDSP